MISFEDNVFRKLTLNISAAFVVIEFLSLQGVHSQFIITQGHRKSGVFPAGVSRRSLMNGPAETETELSRIFAGHPTAKYVTKVKQIQRIDPDVSLLQAIVGMVPPGKKQIMPERNAIQTLVAVQYKEGLRISLFQNTPARFDGKTELVEAMTKELSQLL